MNVVKTVTDINKIHGVPRRPTFAKTDAAAILGGITVGLLTGNWLAALAGGTISGAIANQKQPLEFAIRQNFKKRGLEVVFYYPALYSVKVTFLYATSAYWTIQTTLPDKLTNLNDEDREDWLYGSLISRELPKAMRQIRNLQQ